MDILSREPANGTVSSAILVDDNRVCITIESKLMGKYIYQISKDLAALFLTSHPIGSEIRFVESITCTYIENRNEKTDPADPPTCTNCEFDGKPECTGSRCLELNYRQFKPKGQTDGKD